MTELRAGRLDVLCLLGFSVSLGSQCESTYGVSLPAVRSHQEDRDAPGGIEYQPFVPLVVCVS